MPEPVKVIAVDPGKATGLVVATATVDMLEVEWWGEPAQIETIERVWAEVNRDSGGVIVLESFVPRGGALKFQPYSLELIGFLRAAAHLLGWKLVSQPPMTKNIYHKDALDRFPEVGRGGAGHARDAMAHLLSWYDKYIIVERKAAE